MSILKMRNLRKVLNMKRTNAVLIFVGGFLCGEWIIVHTLYSFGFINLGRGLSTLLSARGAQVAVSIQLWASTLSSARGAQVAVSIQLWASTLSSARGTPSYNLSKPITGGGDSLLFYRIQFFVCPHKLVFPGAADTRAATISALNQGAAEVDVLAHEKRQSSRFLLLAALVSDRETEPQGPGFCVAESEEGRALHVGSGHDRGLGAAVAPGGGVWISGDAQSVDLPTTSDAMRLTRGSGGSDAMLARMSSKGELEYMSYISGDVGSDSGTALHPDGEGGVYVGGYVTRKGSGSHQPAALALHDGSTRWKTKLSGNGNDFVTALALQAVQHARVPMPKPGLTLWCGVSAMGEQFSQEKSTGVWVVGHSTSTHFPGVSKSDQSHRDVGRGAARLDADVLTALLDIDTGVIVKLQTLG
eukprot:gene18266-21775_t